MHKHRCAQKEKERLTPNFIISRRAMIKQTWALLLRPPTHLIASICQKRRQMRQKKTIFTVKFMQNNVTYRQILSTWSMENLIVTLIMTIYGKKRCFKRDISQSLRQIFFLFEPTCALCTVGSYASLSVRLSICLAGLDQKDWTIIHILRNIVHIQGRTLISDSNVYRV